MIMARTDKAYSPVLLSGYQVRAATHDDLDAVVDLINVCAQADIGMDGVERQDKLNDWETPTFNLATDSWVVTTDDGTLAGYMEFWGLEPYVKNYCWGRVHPDHARKGIGTFLLMQAEMRARTLIAAAPDGARVVLVNNGPDCTLNAGADTLLHMRGFRPVRCFTTMAITFDGPPPEPAWSHGITVRAYDPGSETFAVYDALEDAFQDHWGHVTLPFDLWKHWHIEEDDHDPSLWVLALDGDDIAGLVLCSPATTGDPDTGWIGDLGVRRRWRRRGLGRALLLHAFGLFYARGITKVELNVDSHSLTGATRLYESVGMIPTRQWLSYEKELRAGIDHETRATEE